VFDSTKPAEGTGSSTTQSTIQSSLQFPIKILLDFIYEKEIMKKSKLFTIIATAIIALGVFGAVTANAATVSVAVSGNAAGSGTSADPATIAVPSDNLIDGKVLTLAITVDSLSTVANITTTGGVKVIRSYDATTKADAGASSLSVTPTSTTFDVYAYTTSTTAGTIVFSVTGQTLTYHVKGVAGPAYKVALSVPATGNTSGTVTAVANVTDIFGNPVATTPTFTVVNGSAASPTTTVVGEYKSVITLPATTGTTAVGASITAPTAVTGFAPVASASAFVTVSDLAAELAALKLENSALKASLDAEKAGRATDKAAADKAAADAALALEAEKAQVAKLTRQVSNLKAKLKAAKGK
jgi:hypothetical protein